MRSPWPTLPKDGCASFTATVNDKGNATSCSCFDANGKKLKK
jgi:hypothetical protein